MDKTIMYVFSCGCRVEKENICYDANLRRRCFWHDDAILTCRLSVCEECGDEVKNKVKGRVAALCPTCRKIRKEVTLPNLLDADEENQNDTLDPARKYDCVHYLSECLAIGGYLLSGPDASCTGCTRYRHEELDVAEYARGIARPAPGCETTRLASEKGGA